MEKAKKLKSHELYRESFEVRDPRQRNQISDVDLL